MSPLELAREARRALAFTSPIPGVKPHLYLTLTAPKNPGRYVRLFGKEGPLGELCIVHDDGRCVALFKPDAVLRFLERKGLV